MILLQPFFSILFSFLILTPVSFEKGETLFGKYCFQCHQNGNTVLFPEKNLKKETLDRNGMNSIEAIRYLVKNGKNGMPAFGGKLKEEDIEKIATYLLEEAQKTFS